MLPPLVDPVPPLSRAQKERYARHLLLPHLGELGQRRLLGARVCVIGAGGLGAPVLLYLAAAGVGTLGIVDDDVVDVTNLQRQIVHDAASVGRPKVDSACETVLRLNPDVCVVTHELRLDEHNVDLVLSDYDIVVDGTDNFPTRYLVNDSCERLRLPFVWASLQRTVAQVATFWRAPIDGSAGVDLRDLFPVPPAAGSVPACGDAGVLGALCGTIGTMMAGDVVKLITGTGEPLLGRVLLYDSLASRMTEIPLRPRPREVAQIPPEVAQIPPEVAQIPPEVAQNSVCSASSSDFVFRRISPTQLAAALDAPDAPTVLDVREPGEVAIAAIDGSVRIPVDQLEAALPSLRSQDHFVVHCKTGPRAERAAATLRDNGFEHVALLEGGILAWIDQVDPTLPRY